MAQYLYSPAGEGRIIARDRDLSPEAGGTGPLDGKADERLWVAQGPDGSVWLVHLDGGRATDRASRGANGVIPHFPNEIGV